MLLGPRAARNACTQSLQGPTFRSRNSGRDEHGYFAPALAGSKDLGGGREGRARRQSRVSREIVSQNQGMVLMS
jgi:hypothetical protein